MLAVVLLLFSFIVLAEPSPVSSKADHLYVWFTDAGECNQPITFPGTEGNAYIISYAEYDSSKTNLCDWSRAPKPLDQEGCRADLDQVASDAKSCGYVMVPEGLKVFDSDYPYPFGFVSTDEEGTSYSESTSTDSRNGYYNTLDGSLSIGDSSIRVKYEIGHLPEPGSSDDAGGWSYVNIGGVNNKCGKYFGPNALRTYVCGYDHTWYACAYESDLGKYTWAKRIEDQFSSSGPTSTEGQEEDYSSPGQIIQDITSPYYLYNCTKDSQGNWKWFELGEDKDRDGYTEAMGDCADDPEANGLQTTGCPDTLEGCAYPKDSKCAICINPGAPEVCGDNINNDCGGFKDDGKPVKEMDFKEQNGKTSDNCDVNRDACIQREDADGNILAYNILDESLSFADDGGCCGFRGINDLGKISSGGANLCIKNDDALVGTDNKISSLFGDGKVCQEDSEWCWLPAADANLNFKIFTIKQPDEIYDVVSNVEISKITEKTLYVN